MTEKIALGEESSGSSDILSHMNHVISITKSDGTSELFEEEKLISSLKRVGAPAEAIDDIVDEVEKEMRDGMTTSEIYTRAFALLKRHSAPLAIRYSIRRALMELGPDGFPFEKLIARIFNSWGYETMTDQQVMGVCIFHEMDVVAWKGDSLAMVEAKFHNEFGLKSDVKVALYVKARFDDIAGTAFDYGNKKRKLSERWLFTNTKFTDQAIKYCACNDVKLVGWNYPAKDNLHDIIEKNALHPITCLSSISHQQKKDLIGRSIIVCADIPHNLDVLKEVGVKAEDMQRVVEEARMVAERAK